MHELDKNNNFYQILNGLDTLIYITDPYTHEILYINEKMKKVFGKVDLTGRICWQTLQSGMTGECGFCPVKKLLADPSTPVVWEEFNTVTRRYYMNTDSIIKWIDGRTAHMQHSVDITDIRLAEMRLAEAAKNAEHANNAKSEFLSRMSHEIRTPISAIMGMVFIAKSTDDVQKIKNCILKIENSSQHLLELINDILDMSKIEADKLELFAEDFNLEKMLMDICNIISVRADQKKQRLHVSLAPDARANYIGDSLRLSQVITNLLTNAVKFSPEGSPINLDISCIGKNGGKAVLLFEVRDYGIGIAPEKLGRLFFPFEQADGGISRKFGGTGLGLAISKRIVNLMGGEISVESTEGKGSVFRFTAALQKSGGGPHLSSAVNKAGLRILAVDDSPEVLEFFKELGARLEINMAVTASAEEALTLVKEGEASRRPFNIIFMDWKLPGINGVEAAKIIKNEYKERYVIILFSTAEWSEVEDAAKDAGIDRFLPKPLFSSPIIDIVHEFVGVGNKKTGKTQVPDFSGKKILVAEDIDINLEIVYALLDGTNVAVRAAKNGAEAVELFKKEKFDLVLMDINLPVMDGYEATRRIRLLDGAQSVPIIAMTANAFQEDVNRCKAAGMDDHIAKPLNETALWKKLAKYLDVKEDLTMDSTKTGSDYKEMLPYIDVNDGLARLQNNKKLYAKLLKSYLATADFGSMAQPLSAGDFETAREKIHAFKGISANLSLAKNFELSKELEIIVKEKRDHSSVLVALKASVEITGRLIGKLIPLLEA